MTLTEIKRQGEFICNAYHINRLCSEVWRTPGNVYPLISKYGGQPDTVTREAIFSYVADKYYDGDYGKIYDRWLAQVTA